MKILKVLQITLLFLLFAGGMGFAAPAYYVESNWAKNASQWLKNLTFTPSPDGVVDALFAYNIFRILDDNTKRNIHDNLGMSGFYNDPALVNNVLYHQLKPELVEHSALMKAGCMYYSRSFGGEGYWEVIEPIKGQYQYEIPQLILDSAAAASGEILMVIVPFSSWDQNVPAAGDTPIDTIAGRIKSSYSVGPVKNLNDYAVFLKKLSGRFPSQNAYEIVNEMDFPNDAPYFHKGKEYAELVKVSRDNLPPGAKILNGGALGAVNQDTEIFWNDFFDAGGGDNIDVLNIHYAEINYQDATQTKIDPTFYELEKLLGFFDNLMDKSLKNGVLKIKKPIWITEFIVGDKGDPPLNEQQVAEWYVKKFAFTAARNVKKVFVEFGGHIPGSPPLIEEVNPYSYIATISFYTQKLMNYLLSGFTACKELIRAEQYQFTVKGKAVYVLWGNSALPPALRGQSVKTTDIYGNESVIQTQTNWTVQMLSKKGLDEPIFAQP